MSVSGSGASDREVQSNTKEQQSQHGIGKKRSFTKGLSSRMSDAMKCFLRKLDHLKNKGAESVSCLRDYCIRVLQKCESVPVIRLPIKLLIYGMKHCSIGLFALMVSLGIAVQFQSLSVLFISCTILSVLISLALIHKLRRKYQTHISIARAATEHAQFIYDRVNGVMQAGIRLSSYTEDVRCALSVATNTVSTAFSSWLSGEDRTLIFHNSHYEEDGLLDEEPEENVSETRENDHLFFLEFDDNEDDPSLILNAPELSASALVNGMKALFHMGKNFLVGDSPNSEDQQDDEFMDFASLSEEDEFFDAIDNGAIDNMDQEAQTQAAMLLSYLNIEDIT